MDAMITARDYLLDNIGHLTCPGNPSFRRTTQRWFVPILRRTPQGNCVVGEVELDDNGRIVVAPTREELLVRMHAQGR